HEDEERHGDQRVPVENLERLVERHLDGAAPPQPQRRRSADEADDAEDALPGEEQHHHGGEHEDGDELGGHAMGLPRASATSLKNWAMNCSSMRKMPIVIAILTGHRTGDHAE